MTKISDFTQPRLFTYFDFSMTSAIFIRNYDHQMSVWWSKNRKYVTVGSPLISVHDRCWFPDPIALIHLLVWSSSRFKTLMLAYYQLSHIYDFLSLYHTFINNNIHHCNARYTNNFTCTVSPPMSTFFSRKSTPIVASDFSGNFPSQNRKDKQVFPTLESPMIMILKILCFLCPT